MLHIKGEADSRAEPAATGARHDDHDPCSLAVVAKRPVMSRIEGEADSRAEPAATGAGISQPRDLLSSGLSRSDLYKKGSRRPRALSPLQQEHVMMTTPHAL